MSSSAPGRPGDPTGIETELDRVAFDRVALDRVGADVRARPLDLVQHWLPGRPELRLLVLIGRVRGRPHLLISDRPDAARAGLESGAHLASLARSLQTPLIDPGTPQALHAAAVAKPWGRELWYTGIEARGVSRVGSEHPDTAIPLPWLVAALPGRFTGAAGGESPPGHARPPVLVKILDPHPDPVLGDLYFELHEHKQEAYLVIGIDRGAWPEGRGAIRMGFDPALVERLGDAGVRRAFTDAVAAYEPVRRRIDTLLDARRDRAGIARDAVLPPATQRAWLAELPAALVAEERRLRHAVETLTALEPLAPGDLVRIPVRVPHALQHGVRVVEFQTPVYERSILYFGQKVLAQDHWDTQEAAAQMRLRPPPPEPARMLEAPPGVRAEQVAGFDDFRVLRIRLRPGREFRLPPAGHAVVLAIRGEATLAGAAITAETARLVPGPGLDAPLQAGDAGAVCLVALPV